MSGTLPKPLLAAALVACLAVALLGQALVDGSVPPRVSTETVAARAGFAYASGLRTFVAAVLWTRLEKLLHRYYEDVPLVEQDYVYPTIGAVVALDPQMADPYTVGSWYLGRRGNLEAALDLARRGAEENPRSGYLHVNYAQILWFFGKDLKGAERQADLAMASEWPDLVEQHDAYQTIRVIYSKAGRRADEARVAAELERLDGEIGDRLPPAAHDHDGDGRPDH